MITFKREYVKPVYDSKVISVYKDYLKTPDGNTVVYDYIHHKAGGGAGTLLVDEDENTYLVRLYRNSIDGLSLEMPAGGYNNPDESGDVCARREAEEETGLRPTRMYHVANIVSSIGTFDEKTDIYIGTGIVKGVKKLDEDEFIDVVKLPVSEAIDKIYSGEIVDGKTVTVLFAYEHMKREGIIEL